MPTRKIIETKPKTDRLYKAVRLWKRDFLDIVELFDQPNLVLEIEDDRHEYSNAADFLEHAPVVVRDFRISVKSTDSNYGVDRVYVVIYADQGGIYTNCIGNPEANRPLLDRIDIILSQSQKRFGSMLTGYWFVGVYVLITLFVILISGYVLLRLQDHPGIAIWQKNVFSAVLSGSLFFGAFKTLGLFVRCDFWIRTNRGEDTWWKRNRDKMEAELVKAVVYAGVGGLVGYLLPHH